jgi:hypothetical protein
LSGTKQHWLALIGEQNQSFGDWLIQNGMIQTELQIRVQSTW